MTTKFALNILRIALNGTFCRRRSRLIFSVSFVIVIFSAIFSILYFKAIINLRNKNIYAVDVDLSRIKWLIDSKVFNLIQNIEHRYDFIEYKFSSIKLFDLIDQSNNHEHRRRLILFQVKLNELFEINAYQRTHKLNSLKSSILNRINQFQNTKCHLNKILACSLEQDCGYSCLLHHVGICMILAYYMERTAILVGTTKKGIGNLSQTFIPITNTCRFQNIDPQLIRKEIIRPIELIRQEYNGRSGFRKFEKEMREMSEFVQEPIAFFASLFLSYILRYDVNSTFYKFVNETFQKFNISRPYVGIHVRRSDKNDEAHFYGLDEYMKHVDRFYERYFIENPTKNNTERLVYVASDEAFIFDTLKTNYPNYRFIYNSTFTHLAGSLARYSNEGFESFLFDIHFLARSDFLVCTFSSNVCRLAYELMLALRNNNNDFTPRNYYRSLDVPYYQISDAVFYKIAILSSSSSSKPHEEEQFRRGDLLQRRVVSGFDYEEYHHNGYTQGFNLRTRFRKDFPSFKFKNFY